jgi:hypothetical protein
MADITEVLEDIGEEILLTAVVFGGAVGLIVVTRKIVKHFQGSAAPKPPPPIDTTFADTALKDLTTDLKLDPTASGEQGKEDRHRSFFIYRRALDLGIADATLRQDPGLEKLKQQVRAEFIHVNNFLDERLWPDNANRGEYFGGTDTHGLDPRHLDLGNFIGVLITDPPPTTEKDAVSAKTPTPTQVQTLHELDRRNMRVKGIVWRAAALHEVWTGVGTDSNLQKFALTEILDRRLRTVERLHYEASSGATSGGFGTSFLSRDKELITDGRSSEFNGWHDDTRHRIFEAPSMPRLTTLNVGLLIPVQSSPPVITPVMELRDTLRAALIDLKLLVNDPGSPRFNVGATTSSAWYQNQPTDEFDWNVWPGTRIKEPLLEKAPNEPFPKEWVQVADTAAARGYAWIMKPRNFATEAIKELFVVFPPQDVWARSWLHADGVMSALHLEALFFGLRRRKALELDIKKTAEERQTEEEAAKALQDEEQKLDAEERSLKAQLNNPGLKQAIVEAIEKRLDEIAKRSFEIFLQKNSQRGAQEAELNKTFNELPKKFSLALDDYFEVRRGIVRAENGIMRPGRTDHFENTAVPFDDLQIGDQVLYETSPVLQALGSNAWEYPTVLITELDSLPPGKKLDPKKLTVQGFGTAELGQPSFQLLLAKSIDNTLNAVRRFIQTSFAKEKAKAQSAGRPFDPPEKFLWDPGLMSQSEVSENDRGTLRLWNPYDDKWDEPGPWWVWLSLKAPMWHGSFPLPVEKTLAKVPHGFVWLGTTLLFERDGEAIPSKALPIGPGFKEPDWQDVTDEGGTADPKLTIFAPLFEPEGGWINYFIAKAKDKNAKRGPRLLPVMSDRSWFPGLVQNDSKVRVIRPQLKKQ